MDFAEIFVVAEFKISGTSKAMIEPKRYLHLRIDDEIQPLFTLFRTPWSTANGPEETWLPLNALFGTLGSLFPLSIFDLGLFCRGNIVIPREKTLHGAIPEFLGFSLALLLERPRPRRRVFGICRIKQKLSFSGL